MGASSSHTSSAKLCGPCLDTYSVVLLVTSMFYASIPSRQSSFFHNAGCDSVYFTLVRGFRAVGSYVLCGLCCSDFSVARR